MKHWASYAVCPCSWKRQAPFGHVSHVIYAGSFITCCPACAGPLSKFAVRVMRWVPPDIKLFRPSTWDNEGHWETRL